MNPEEVEELSFRNLVLFYKNELLAICKGVDSRKGGLSYKKIAELRRFGVLEHSGYGRSHRYQLSEKTLNVLGRKHQPHRYLKREKP